MSQRAKDKPRLDIFFHSRMNTWLSRNKDDIDFDVRLTDGERICSVTLYTNKAHITRRYIVSSFMKTTDLKGLVDLAVQHLYWELSDMIKKDCD